MGEISGAPVIRAMCKCPAVEVVIEVFRWAASTPRQAINLLPCAIPEHRLDAPRGPKDVKRLGEAVIVDQAGVDGEDAHEQDQVAPVEEGVPDLVQENKG